MAKANVNKANPRTWIDPRELRSENDRKAEQLSRLRDVIINAQNQPYYEKAFRTVPVINSFSDLEKLPVLRKQDLIDIQPAAPPFGGLMGDSSRADYLFVSPGPIHEPGFMDPDFWRSARALRSAGFKQGDIVHNTFSYHLTPGAWIFDSGSRAIGCSVIPAGNAPIEQQVMAIFQYQANAYVGTPDFLKTLIEACQAADRGPVPFTKAMVSGGALTPGLRDFFFKSGVQVLQCYATAELGLIAYEVDISGQMVADEDVIIEIIDPDTGCSVPNGQVGEVVVTTLRKDYPLIRFGTGDLSSFVAPEFCKADLNGRTGAILAGWLGRADQASKIRGMFVRPSQLTALCSQIEGLQRVRLVIDRDNEKDDIMLFCEMEDAPVEAVEGEMLENIAQLFRELCHLKTKVSLVDHGTLVDDGRVIVDMRR
ncbi:phenylacetate--CoA ligase family protein [Lentilitoribacter sp. EG35]|uniref:phenylacetate--CoA ligase family protein n=1 Tax=Lentilitoribacter sp. EG35 TaxID=3234192 RepID=UPI003460D01F